MHEFLRQCGSHMGRDERTHVAAKSRDFLYDSGTEKRVGVLRHHENRFDTLVQFTIHQGELKFKFKVRNGAQSTDDSLRAALFNVFHEQTIEGIGFYVREVADGFSHEFEALFQFEKRTFALVLGNGDDDAIEKFCRSLNDVQVSVCERIKTPRVDCDTHTAQCRAWAAVDEQEKRGLEQTGQTHTSYDVI